VAAKLELLMQTTVPYKHTYWTGTCTTVSATVAMMAAPCISVFKNRLNYIYAICIYAECAM